MAKLFSSVVLLVFVLHFCCGCYHKEEEALLLFKADSNSTSMSSWVKGTDCCLWPGISCNESTHHVLAVRIPGNVSAYFSSEPHLLEGAIRSIRSESLCNLPFVQTIDLYLTGISGTIPPCFGNLSFLAMLDLSGNQLTGGIPSSLSNLSSLHTLVLSDNQFNGGIPSSLSNLSSLGWLDLSWNHLSGCIPESLGYLPSLKVLDLSSNQLNGTFPSSFSKLSSLEVLRAERNVFTHIASSELPSSLKELTLTFNSRQIISEAFFHNLSKLDYMSLSNCVFNCSPTWIPSFQLYSLFMTSCELNGQIPSWISTQFSLEGLEISHSNIVGEIPSWLLAMSLNSINLTANHLQGPLVLNTLAWNSINSIDVSSNGLCGQLPPIWPSTTKVLNLAHNHLNGIIAPSLADCFQLSVLNLENNNLTGVIPFEIGKLSQLRSLSIRNNKVSGSLPSSISNCSELIFLDAGQNLLIGQIPKSIGYIPKLRVLSLRRNHLDGTIPAEIAHLTHLQILDLSSNQLSGLIPQNIFNLQAMMIEPHEEFITASMEALETHDFFYEDGLHMDSKGRDEVYTYIYANMISIDLSDNQLTGNVPSDLGKLKGLMLLNLSMNNLNGPIPNSIVQMTWLESLDLSANHFSGRIPPDLGSLSYLEVLDFSNNNLSGNIPQGGHMATFDESSYLRNPNLWGCPLPKNCSWPQFGIPAPSIDTAINEEEQSEESVWYWIGVGLSYGAGFAIVVSIIVTKRNWGHKYFQGVDVVLKFCFPSLRKMIL